MRGLWLMVLLLGGRGLGQVAGSVDFSKGVGRVEGFGLSEAFGQGEGLRALPEDKRREVLDLLFDRRTGAGLSMVRLGIGTDQEFESEAVPDYRFDGVDGGQVWFAQQAQRYGVREFVADAWTAPALMKTNQAKVGGSLCGLPKTACDGADWTRRFTEELLDYVRSYRGLGIRIASLGFLNEPDIGVGYASMRFAPDQTAKMMQVFGPMVRTSGLDLKITCCDVSRWDNSRSYVGAVEAAAGQFLDIVTAHEYGQAASVPVETKKPVWMSEWSSSVSYFNAQWDCRDCVGEADGISLAHDVVQAFALGHVHAYLVWWGSSTLPAGLIRTEKDGYTVAKRYYALAGISRFVTPGAERVEVSLANEQVDAAAFHNGDGSRVLLMVNRAARPVEVELNVDEGATGSDVRSFLTDNGHALQETPVGSLAGRTLTVILRGRSMTTVVLEAPKVSGAPRLAATETLERFADGSYGGMVRIENVGTGTAGEIRVEKARLGKMVGDTGPQTATGQSLGSLAPGGWMVWPFNFAAGAGRPGEKVLEEVAGSFLGGKLAMKERVSLP